MPRIRQHQSVFNPVIAQPGAVGTLSEGFWPAQPPKSQRGAAISSSGIVAGGDLSRPMPFPWFDEPRPKRPGLTSAQQWFGGSTNLLVTVPAITTGEWYQGFSQPKPKRPGLSVAEQWFQFATTQLIVVPGATAGELFPLFPPRAPKRPGLSAWSQQFLFDGLPKETGLPTTAGTWYQQFGTHKYRPGLSAAEMQFATFVPPAVVVPPAGGGFHRRRRFVRRGRVY